MSRTTAKRTLKTRGWSYRRAAPRLGVTYQHLTPAIAVVFTVLAGRWHWRVDAPNAHHSAGYASYPAAMASARSSLGPLLPRPAPPSARSSLGLPAIGEAGQHLTATSLT